MSLPLSPAPSTQTSPSKHVQIEAPVKTKMSAKAPPGIPTPAATPPALRDTKRFSTPIIPTTTRTTPRLQSRESPEETRQKQDNRRSLQTGPAGTTVSTPLKRQTPARARPISVHGEINGGSPMSNLSHRSGTSNASSENSGTSGVSRTGSLRRTRRDTLTGSMKNLDLDEKIGSPKPQRAPWRPPGKYQIPDLPSPPPKAKSPTPPPMPRKNMSTKDKHQLLHKKPWVPAGKCTTPTPSSPPKRKRVRPHVEFERKMLQAVPAQKVMEEDPFMAYTGMAKIGSGANGAVLRAMKRANNASRVAIKRCYIDDSDTPHLAYILRELRIMGKLNHANLVSLREATLWGDYVWMAMELLKCSVFGLLCNISTGLPEPIAIFVIRECLQGLIYLHSKGYMHRDVKCENILLGMNGEVKLADFGLATPTTRINCARLGTAKWMAPEVIEEQVYTDTVDVWSMAITTIEMMDRVPPLYYLEDNRQIFEEILCGPQPHFTFAEPAFIMKDIVEWMLDRNGKRRPNAATVLNEYDHHIKSGYLICATRQDLAMFVRDVFGSTE